MVSVSSNSNSYPPQPSALTSTGKGGTSTFQICKWEIAVIAFSIALILFVAVPNYVNYLDSMRGHECSVRLTLIANCLQYLAERNKTKPGETICAVFDLNEFLELAQRKAYSKASIQATTSLFLKIGAEPDCVAGGDYTVDFTLGEDGNIIYPVCSRSQGSNAEYHKKHGICVVDETKVDGKIGLDE